MSSTNNVTPEFIAEAQEIVDALNRDLIAAETQAKAGEVDPDLVNRLFRSAHSLKGLAGMFGLDALAHLAHELESVLDGMRLGKVQLDGAALDVLFGTVESFGSLIADAALGETTALAVVEELVVRLKRVASGSGAKQGEPLQLLDLGEDVLGVLTEYEEHRLRENVAKGRNLFILSRSFDLTNFDVGLAEIDAAIKGLGEVITKLPSTKATDAGGISFDIIVGTEATHDGLVKALADEKIEVVAVGKRGVVASAHKGTSIAASPTSRDGDDDAALATEPSVLEAPMIEHGAEDGQSVRSVSRTVRVDIRRLDKLMNLVGELGLTKAAFLRISESMKREHGFTGLSVDLHKEWRNFELRLAELQAGIMEVRMVPLANLFERMVRTARKVGRELRREVRVEVTGEHTELDKLIVEDLAEPLMHLIRNAIDHGIEEPDQRLAAGKPAEGVVRLIAAAQGNHVAVTVSDDGKGIDIQRTLQLALERGIITPERASELTRREIYNLLFMPGFSTRTEVSEYSGRGVGLDVVKTNIAQLSGVIDIDSKEGVGTTITVLLPITLAIIPALVVGVAGRTYAIPLNTVQETLALKSADLKTIERREVVTVRGATVPLVDLRRNFGLDGPPRPASCFGVVAGAGDSRIALIADELVGQQDIVIKSLGRWLRNTRGIAGAAELGNQQTILVIDMVELLGEAIHAEARTKSPERSGP